MYQCVHVCLCFHLILQRFFIVGKSENTYIKSKVLNKEVANRTPLHSNRECRHNLLHSFFLTWGWQEGYNKERMEEGEAVCHQRGGDLEYTINVHKHICAVTFKRYTPSPSPTLRERAANLQWKLELPDVPINSRLSKDVRSQRNKKCPIQYAPYYICMWLSRKFIYTGDLWACHHFQKPIVSQGGWELIIK